MTMSAYSHDILLEAASQIAGTQNYPDATLYLVPTPIGNLADITFRALHVLQLADAIACEDTRNTRLLLSHYGITSKTLFALHQHNEQHATAELLRRLQQGERIALVTDAGTPAISDPGARAVTAVSHAGLRIVALPGASSVITALSAAGVTEGDVLFHGFLPTKAQERQHCLAELIALPYAVVLLEAPHRIETLAQELARLTPARAVTLARELTKQFEQIVTYPAEHLPTWLQQRPEHKKGEFVCIIHPPAAETASDVEAHDDALTLALAHMPTKAAAQLIARLTGQPKNKLYERALQLKKSNPHADK